MDRLLLIGMAMVLGGTTLGIVNLKWRARRAATKIEVLPLNALASREIRYFPGRPSGYVGYTDYAAMQVELNDGLVGRPADEQFTLIGFGEGFSEGMLDRVAHENVSTTCVFHVESASEEDSRCLGWLSLMQKKGTDNAGPSTANLHSVLWKVGHDMIERGPVTMKFWHKFHSKTDETLQHSGTSTADLARLCERLETSRLGGKRLALEASLRFGQL